MRSSRHAQSNSVPLAPVLVPETSSSSKSIVAGIHRLADSIDRLTTAVEARNNARLGDPADPRYTRSPDASGLTDERTMAGILGISHRTLARYRRDGRLPGCWVRNGRPVFWHADETVAAWRKGVA